MNWFTHIRSWMLAQIWICIIAKMLNVLDIFVQYLNILLICF